MIIGYAYALVLTALTVVSIRSLLTLGTAAPWTSLGWACTILYDCTATEEILTQTHLPYHMPYVFLIALTIAFVVAGIRDEPQGDPWYWPTRLSQTRAMKRKR